jgi:transposase
MNSSSPIYVGIDVAKLTLQMHLMGHQHELANDPEGHAKLCALLQKVPGAHVVLEATGGYETALMAALHAAGCPVSRINPARARAAAKAKGRNAKSDPIDAAELTDYGHRFQPRPTLPPAATQTELATRTQWLTQLRDTLAKVRCLAEHHTDPFVIKEHAKLVKSLEDRIERVVDELAMLCQRDAKLQERVAALDAIEGVGVRTALLMLAFVPELGTLARGEIVSLCGLAPHNHDSGAMQGKRRICGGRAAARTTLYMAALSGSQRNPVLKKFYDNLIAEKKPFKVALTAVMRKLVIHMNSQLKAVAQKTEEDVKKKNIKQEKTVEN